MAQGTPLTTDNTPDAGLYVYGAFVLKKGKLVDESDNYIVDENGNNIYLKGIVPSED